MSTNQMQVSDDANLVRQAQQGSREAYAELVYRHHRAVRWLVGRYFSDSHSVDDLAQDVFCEAMIEIGKLRKIDTFRSWLLTLARNKAVSRVRQIVRQKSKHSQLEQALVDAQESNAELEFESFCDERSVEFLRECISLLQPKHQSLVHQFYFDKRPSKQIARDNEVQDHSIRAVLFRIRQALRKCLLRKFQVGGEGGAV